MRGADSILNHSVGGTVKFEMIDVISFITFYRFEKAFSFMMTKYLSSVTRVNHRLNAGRTGRTSGEDGEKHELTRNRP